MLTSQKVIDAINEQIGYEFSAELQYYAIGAHFASEALPQLSQHFFQQAEEEKGHALRFIKYVVDAGGRVVIPAIDAPKSKFKTPRDAIKLSLDQEIHVTQQINGLVGLARKCRDRAEPCEATATRSRQARRGLASESKQSRLDTSLQGRFSRGPLRHGS